MMAKAVGISASSVQRIWHAHGLQPHRFSSSSSPTTRSSSTSCATWSGFMSFAVLDAIVLSVDEKAEIEALDRTQPGLPMKKGRAGTMTHDYKRHGTTTLFAALDVLEGKVIGRSDDAIVTKSLSASSTPSRRRCQPEDRARGPRQLRRPQASESAAMARPTPALHLPLHADLLLVAQRRRGLLCWSRNGD